MSNENKENIITSYLLYALHSVFWYEGLLAKSKEESYKDNNGMIYDEHCWLIEFIKELKSFNVNNNYSTKDLEDFNNRLFGNIYYFDYQNRHTVIWQILVEMFGDYGTSPRYGWIQKTKECADFLQMIINID